MASWQVADGLTSGWYVHMDPTLEEGKPLAGRLACKGPHLGLDEVDIAELAALCFGQ